MIFVLLVICCQSESVWYNIFSRVCMEIRVFCL